MPRRTAKAGRAQERISAETVERCDGSEHACTGHIAKGHYANV